MKVHRLAGDMAQGHNLIFGSFLEIPEYRDDTSALPTCKYVKKLLRASLKARLKYLICLTARET